MDRKRINNKKRMEINYQKPAKDIKQNIIELLMEKYPPTRIEEGNKMMINHDNKISYFFAGIKVTVKNEICQIYDTSSINKEYVSIDNRLILTLILKYIKEYNLEVKIEQTKRNRKKL